MFHWMFHDASLCPEDMPIIFPPGYAAALWPCSSFPARVRGSMGPLCLLPSGWSHTSSAGGHGTSLASKNGLCEVGSGGASEAYLKWAAFVGRCPIKIYKVHLLWIIWDCPPTVLVCFGACCFFPRAECSRTEERPPWKSPPDQTKGTYEDFSAMLGLPWRWCWWRRDFDSCSAQRVTGRDRVRGFQWLTEVALHMGKRVPYFKRFLSGNGPSEGTCCHRFRWSTGRAR